MNGDMLKAGNVKLYLMAANAVVTNAHSPTGTTLWLGHGHPNYGDDMKEVLGRREVLRRAEYFPVPKVLVISCLDVFARSTVYAEPMSKAVDAWRSRLSGRGADYGGVDCCPSQASGVDF